MLDLKFAPSKMSKIGGVCHTNHFESKLVSETISIGDLFWIEVLQVSTHHVI